MHTNARKQVKNQSTAAGLEAHLGSQIHKNGNHG